MNTSSCVITLGAQPANQWQVSANSANLVRNPAPPRPQTFLTYAPQGGPGKTITIDLARTALVIIDMQNDFCHDKGWLASLGVDVAGARKPIKPLRKFLPMWRSQGLPVVWVNWGNRPDRANLSPGLLHVYKPHAMAVGLGDALLQAPAKHGQSNKVLEKNAWGAAIVDELVPEPSDLQFDKHRMSGFWDTALDASLRQMGITTLMFGGVNADQCVLATLMDANFLGYDTILVEDLSATTSPVYCWEATLYNVRQCFGFSTLSTDVFNELAATHA
jgi:nicotinamidase-related amidase